MNESSSQSQFCSAQRHLGNLPAFLPRQSHGSCSCFGCTKGVAAPVIEILGFWEILACSIGNCLRVGCKSTPIYLNCTQTIIEQRGCRPQLEHIGTCIQLEPDPTDTSVTSSQDSRMGSGCATSKSAREISSSESPMSWDVRLDASVTVRVSMGL